VVLGVVLLGGGSAYHVNVLFTDAGQLVKGARVVVGGIPVGKVQSIELDDRNRARVRLSITDGDFQPLHEGTIASIGSPSLSTAAGRNVTLRPGPNSNPKIGDDGTIAPESTNGIVELDALFNTLDYQTRSELQDVVHGSATMFANGQASAANKGLEYLNPALSQTRLLTGELLRDQQAFERFVVSSATVVSALAPRDRDLQDGITSAAALTERLARQDDTIGSLLQRAPALVKQASTTLGDVDDALGDARPALRAAKPVAPRLAKVLDAAAPVTRGAKPAVTDLAALLPDVQTALKGLPQTAKLGTKAFADATGALKGSAPIVAGLRPYAPDVVAGLINGFGGNVGGYYDANGRYARIAFELPPDFLVQGASVFGAPVGSLVNTALGGGFTTKFPNYCPGGSVQPADSSMPFVDDAVKDHCDPNATPRP